MEKVKETTMEISKETTPAVDEKRIELAKAAFESFATETSKKVYLVPGGTKTSGSICTFLEEKAEFAAHESLGIVKAHEDVVASTKKSKKELYLSSLCIEAIAYYISKASGTGLAEAREFKDNLFMPINDAMAKISEDRKTIEVLKQEWAAAAQGIKLEELQAQPQND